MAKWRVGVVSLVGVPSIVFGVAYGVGCSNDADDTAKNGEEVRGKCHVDDNPCTIENCLKGVIGVETLQDGTEVDAGTKECWHIVCREFNGETKPSEVPLDVDTTCSVGVCDGIGNCVGSCSDGKQNGDETGVDCGGQWCPKCLKEMCNAASECQSKYCADGICCNAACDGGCESCKLADSFGICTNIPLGWQDGNCTDGHVCNGQGGCNTIKGWQCSDSIECLSGLICAGACESSFSICTSNGSCGSGNKCVKQCRLPADSPCLLDSDCASLHCNNSTCQ